MQTKILTGLFGMSYSGKEEKKGFPRILFLSNNSNVFFTQLEIARVHAYIFIWVLESEKFNMI